MVRGGAERRIDRHYVNKLWTQCNLLLGKWFDHTIRTRWTRTKRTRWAPFPCIRHFQVWFSPSQMPNSEFDNFGRRKPTLYSALARTSDLFTVWISVRIFYDFGACPLKYSNLRSKLKTVQRYVMNVEDHTFVPLSCHGCSQKLAKIRDWQHN